MKHHPLPGRVSAAGLLPVVARRDACKCGWSRWLREQVRDVARTLASQALHALQRAPARRCRDLTAANSLQPFAIRGDLLEVTADPGWSAADDSLRRPALTDANALAADRSAGPHRRRAAPTEPDASRGRSTIDCSGQPASRRASSTRMCTCPQFACHRQPRRRNCSTGSTPTPSRRRCASPTPPCAPRKDAAVFLDALLAHGTTSAVVFPTVHARLPSMRCSKPLSMRGMRHHRRSRCLMDRHAPDGPHATTSTRGRARLRGDLIGRWHGRERLARTR